MSRRQLPPQIRKVSVTDRRTGKPMVRYEVTVDPGHHESGKRRQIRRRFTTEADARAELASVQGSVTSGTYLHSSALTVDQVCEEWLASKYSLKRSTLQGHRVKLAALRDELGTIEVPRLTKGDLAGLVSRLRRGEVQGRQAWAPRSCNYLPYLITAVLEDQVDQDHIIRNVGRLVDRVAGDPQKFRTLTEAEMFKNLDHECRDRHLWTLALYGLRRGEIAGLKWSHVNLTDKPLDNVQGLDELPPRHLRIAETRVTVAAEILDETPKSKASRRMLPLPDELVDVLKVARRSQLEERMAFGEGYGPGEHVACDETGQPYHPDLLTSRWRRMLDELGIKRVRLHDARHSCTCARCRSR